MCARLRSGVADGGASRLRTSRSRSQTAVRHRPKRPSFDFCGWERASLARDATWSFVVRTDDSSLAWICWTTAQVSSVSTTGPITPPASAEATMRVVRRNSRVSVSSSSAPQGTMSRTGVGRPGRSGCAWRTAGPRAQPNVPGSSRRTESPARVTQSGAKRNDTSACRCRNAPLWVTLAGLSVLRDDPGTFGCARGPAVRHAQPLLPGRPTPVLDIVPCGADDDETETLEFRLTTRIVASADAGGVIGPVVLTDDTCAVVQQIHASDESSVRTTNDHVASRAREARSHPQKSKDGLLGRCRTAVCERERDVRSRDAPPSATLERKRAHIAHVHQVEVQHPVDGDRCPGRRKQPGHVEGRAQGRREADPSCLADLICGHDAPEHPDVVARRPAADWRRAM